MTLFSPFEDKVRPGVTSTQQELLFANITVLVPMKQGGEIWLQRPKMRDALAANRKNLILAPITTPRLPSFSNDLFSERPF